MNDNPTNPESSLAHKPFSFRASIPGSSFAFGSSGGSAKSFTFGGSTSSGIGTRGGPCNLNTLPNPVQEANIIQEVPAVAEAKEVHRPSHQVLALKREIMTYAGGQAHFIERVDEQARIIEEQKSTITEMQQHILNMETELVRLRNDAEIAVLDDFERQELTRFKNATDNYLNKYQENFILLRQQLDLLENNVEDLQNCKKQTEHSIESYEDQFWESYNNKYRR